MHSVGLFNIWTSQRSIAIDSKNQISFWSCNAKQYAMILLTFMVLFLVTLATEFTFLLSKRDGLNLRFFFWLNFKSWWLPKMMTDIYFSSFQIKDIYRIFLITTLSWTISPFFPRFGQNQYIKFWNLPIVSPSEQAKQARKGFRPLSPRWEF